MKLKLALAALVLSALPAVATAMCLHGEEKITTAACAEGQVWDAVAQACVDSTA